MNTEEELKDVKYSSPEYRKRYVAEFVKILGVHESLADMDCTAWIDSTPDLNPSGCPELDATESASYWNGG